MPMLLNIVTPEKTVFSDEVDNVLLPGEEGEIGVLPMHAGLVTALKPGELRYHHNGRIVTLAVGSGYAEVTQEKVVVLTDMALDEGEIDEASMEKAIQRAKEKLTTMDHDMNAEEVAFLQGIVTKSTAAINFKRKYR
ncbi:MAG: ATP synthase F1 subunit epsilon [Verrucomicrobiales bacterium]|nr:ATP synthase F1 subunit epsilon [Verrucomicrobiota bacterium JB022]